MNKKEIVEQTKLAFNFIEKLYFESSYLIKEIEGILAQEDERFIIAQPGGYGITSRGSNSLRAVEYWLLKKFSVCFIPEEYSKKTKTVVSTYFNKKLRIIFLRFVLHDKDITEPKVYIGVLQNIAKKTEENKYPQKVEHIVGHIEYNDSKILKNLPDIDYEDNYIKMKGKIISHNLYDIKDSNDISEKLINPILKIFRNK